tara:strand:- start:456 stop:1103 length:648 start_codon:yes stop_codon:yes gene_type:complete
MKLFVFLTTIFLISSCSRIDTSKIAPGYVQAYNSIKQLITGVNNNISPEIIKAIPYASMLVKIGKGPESLMILESINNGDYTWVSADGVYLVINNGRIIKTYGLKNNLKEVLLPFSEWNNLNQNFDYISYFSFSSPDFNNLKVLSNFSLQNKQLINLKLSEKNLQLIEERIFASDIAWEEINKYWFDDDNFVWKSIQHISPKLPPIHLEITKKPL